MHQFCHNFNIFKELLLSCTSGWPKDTELIVQCSLKSKYHYAFHQFSYFKLSISVSTIFFRYWLFMTKSWPYSSSWIYISRADRVLTRRHYCLYSAAGRGSATSRTQRPTTKWKLLLLITRALFNPNF